MKSLLNNPVFQLEVDLPDNELWSPFNITLDTRYVNDYDDVSI